MKQPLPWAPKTLIPPSMILNVPTAWNGIESALPALLNDFHVAPLFALEFGCERGYSAAALANYFMHVTTVDTFAGDCHAGYTSDSRESFRQAKLNLSQWRNVLVINEDWKVFADNSQESRYDLIHIDIEHSLAVTKPALAWAVEHAPVVIAHDTRSFPEVMQACGEVAEEHGRLFYEWPECHGLGILCTEAPHE